MTQFEETVHRCQDWIKRQETFEALHFTRDHEGPHLTNPQDKIQFRTLQLLMQEFDNLPLIYQGVTDTTAKVYQEATNLLDRIPSFNKTAKTRTAHTATGIIKTTYKNAQELLLEVQKSPVSHDEFRRFQTIVYDSIQTLERVSMFLEDGKTQKSLKQLTHYYKLVNQIPIHNSVIGKLSSRIEYYDIMERVKKDISNPAKYDQIKEHLGKLRAKGFQSAQHAKLEARLATCMGWYQAQLLLKQPREASGAVDLVINQAYFKSKMVDADRFTEQMRLVQNQIATTPDFALDWPQKLELIRNQRIKIRKLLEEDEPDLAAMIEVLQERVKEGLLFDQLSSLFTQVTTSLLLLAKIQYLLNPSEEMINQETSSQFLSAKEAFTLIQYFDKNNCTKRTKEIGDQIISKVSKSKFPKKLPEWRKFISFMQKCHEWSINAQSVINEFKHSGNIQNFQTFVEESKRYLPSQQIEEDISKMEVSIRWHEKIKQKSNCRHPSQANMKFIRQLENDLQQLQATPGPMQEKALKYMSNNHLALLNLLKNISQTNIENWQKLSELSKFCKQIDRDIQRYNLEDKIICGLRNQIQQQLIMIQEWRQRYLCVKRFQKKRLQRKEEDENRENNRDNNREGSNFKENGQKELMEQEGEKVISQGDQAVFYQNYTPILLQNAKIPQLTEGQKRKFSVRNNQFCWYFKLLLLVFQFYNGLQLKYSIQELVKLKANLGEIYRFMLHYYELQAKKEKSDCQLEALQKQGEKFPVFSREIHLLRQKNAYVGAWKELAIPVIRSVPILSMEIKATKPQQLLELLEQKKNQKAEGLSRLQNEDRNESSSKRIRKPNPVYNNPEIALITQQTLGFKPKKKRKGLNSDSEYRSALVSRKHIVNEEEDFERIQALLKKGQVTKDMVFIEDPNKYCICRQGVLNQNSIMIQCESHCQEWFHIECIGVKRHIAKSDFRYYCVGCQALYGVQSIGGHFYWDTNCKISQYSFNEILREGRELGIEVAELKKIQVINDKISAWKTATSQLLSEICSNFQINLEPYNNRIYQLFLNALWLPTYHYQFTILRKLMLASKETSHL